MKIEPSPPTSGMYFYMECKNTQMASLNQYREETQGKAPQPLVTLTCKTQATSGSLEEMCSFQLRSPSKLVFLLQLNFHRHRGNKSRKWFLKVVPTAMLCLHASVSTSGVSGGFWTFGNQHLPSCLLLLS